MITRRDALRALALAGAGGLPATAWTTTLQPGGASEILIRGGRVANADAVVEADVRIAGATIAEVGPRLDASPPARVIEARGRFVLPGGVDPHTHLHPGFVDDMTSGSRAALAGGITTVGTFAGTQKDEPLAAALDRLAARVQREAIADVILHGQTWPPSAAVRAAMPALVERGQPSLKWFLPRADFAAQVPEFILTLEAARAAGIVSLLHCEDAALLAAAVRRLEADGRTSLAHYAASRPAIAEVAATQQALAWSESTGAPIYIVHLSSARALDACRAARAAGVPVYVETRPLYLHMTEERLRGPDGPLYVGQPPLRTSADAEALWRGLADGAIDVLATDHAPWTRAQKMDPALTISRLRPGMSDLQFMLPLYFSEGVHKRSLPLTRFVATTAANPARIFGLYPRKGVIRAGADADVVVWDPSRVAAISADADLSNSDYSIYDGWQVTGWPETTIRRGEIVYERGQVIGQPGSGALAMRRPWRRD